MTDCHLTIKFNPKVNNDKNDNYLINFCEDHTIAKPQFIKNATTEHTIQSRWITPCRVINKLSKINDRNGKYYNAFYHPLAYQLAKNQEFKRIIIENAIENVCMKNKLISEFNYDIVSTIASNCFDERTFSRPRYEISSFSSTVCQQKFIQLFIWLPFIISSNSIIIETSDSRFYLQTEKPHKYELNISWPIEVENLKICFSNFLKKDKHLIVVGEYLSASKILADNLSEENNVCDKENKSPSTEENQLIGLVSPGDNTLDTDSQTGEYALYEIHESCPNEIEIENPFYEDTIDESNSDEVRHYDQNQERSNKNLKKERRVRFNSFNSCLIFQESKPVTEISEKTSSKRKVPMKTNDGCSAKKYNYQLNKSQKNNKGNKSARSKRNSNKQKK